MLHCEGLPARARPCAVSQSLSAASWRDVDTLPVMLRGGSTVASVARTGSTCERTLFQLYPVTEGGPLAPMKLLTVLPACMRQRDGPTCVNLPRLHATAYGASIWLLLPWLLLSTAGGRPAGVLGPAALSPGAQRLPPPGTARAPSCIHRMEEEEQQGHGHVGVTAESTTTILARESRHDAGTMSTLGERGQTSDKVRYSRPNWTFFPRKIYLRLDWLYRRSTAKASCCLVFSKVDVFSRKRPVLVGLDIVLGEL